MKPSGFACKESEAKWYNRAAGVSLQAGRQVRQPMQSMGFGFIIPQRWNYLYHILNKNNTKLNKIQLSNKQSGTKTTPYRSALGWNKLKAFSLSCSVLLR